ncbi:hypothetical protein [Actinomycetospora chiangmaiensis]|uniref:hypothetical protein n=1 Tax=Actinomycetospora chiangmaiensis TaxID=402650 RepID=UPI0012FB730F|nr:hypothetical protein [Actinomycetospora chiangmaiensis]
MTEPMRLAAGAFGVFLVLLVVRAVVGETGGVPYRALGRVRVVRVLDLAAVLAAAGLLAALLAVVVTSLGAPSA